MAPTSSSSSLQAQTNASATDQARPSSSSGPSVTPSEWWESQIPFLIEELQDSGIQEDDAAEQACGPSVTPSEWWESQIPFLIEELQDGGIQEDDEAEQDEARALFAESGDDEDELLTCLPTPVASDVRRSRSLTRMCRRGITIGQILASQLGLTSSHLGSNLVYLKEEVDVAKLYFRHMSEFRSNGKGCVARMANKSAKISKTVSS
ncbi:uncharacterized protein [Lolium perenne]|uniref:uncharacterized protein isoform X2 n=1 Tax=Lolium perenne TaxID=4522 RepID=UPI0021F526E9|nr:uncharacterized protein LOC127305940 isoform X2 [Lolium perenne]